MSSSVASARRHKRLTVEQLLQAAGQKVASRRLPKRQTLHRSVDQSGVRERMLHAYYATHPYEWARDVVEWDADPWQIDLLKSHDPQLIVNCCRQSGKTTTAATLAGHIATFKPGGLVVSVSPAQRQAAELLRSARAVFRKANPDRVLRRDNVFDFETMEGARVITLPSDEDTMRGTASVDLLIFDEASRIPDDAYLAALPFITVSRGRRIAMSTPKGERGWWWRAWTGQDGEEWSPWEVPWRKCPRLDPQMMANIKKSMGPTRFAQEYECTFNTVEGALFDPADVAATQRVEIQTWDL